MTQTVTYAPAVAGETRPALRWWLFGVLVLCNVGDVVTTRVGLDRGAIETNPLMRDAVESLWTAVLAKMLLLGVAAVIVAAMPERSRKIDVVLAGAIGWYLMVVSWNVYIIGIQTGAV